MRLAKLSRLGVRGKYLLMCTRRRYALYRANDGEPPSLYFKLRLEEVN